jgi:hypothetical protein
LKIHQFDFEETSGDVAIWNSFSGVMVCVIIYGF